MEIHVEIYVEMYFEIYVEIYAETYMYKMWIFCQVTQNKEMDCETRWQKFVKTGTYDSISDVPESWVRFASKILTPHRMH